MRQIADDPFFSPNLVIQKKKNKCHYCKYLGYLEPQLNIGIIEIVFLIYFPQ